MWPSIKIIYLKNLPVNFKEFLKRGQSNLWYWEKLPGVLKLHFFDKQKLLYLLELSHQEDFKNDHCIVGLWGAKNNPLRHVSQMNLTTMVYDRLEILLSPEIFLFLLAYLLFTFTLHTTHCYVVVFLMNFLILMEIIIRFCTDFQKLMNSTRQYEFLMEITIVF